MSEELKPCPFCGAAPYADEGETMAVIECVNQQCSMRPSISPDNEKHASGLELATDAWNRRAPLVVTDEMVEMALLIWYGTPYPMTGDCPQKDRTSMRAALGAALRAVQ